VGDKWISLNTERGGQASGWNGSQLAPAGSVMDTESTEGFLSPSMSLRVRKAPMLLCPALPGSQLLQRTSCFPVYVPGLGCLSGLLPPWGRLL
jgi:hypothetical protein